MKKFILWTMAFVALGMGAVACEPGSAKNGTGYQHAVTATCKDGTVYRKETTRGACSGHGGVKRWAPGYSNR